MAEQKKNVAMAIVAYIIFFIPLLTKDKDDPFVKYHVKQGLTLFLASVIVWMVVQVVPIIGPLFIGPILNIAIIVLLVIGIMNAANGVEKPLPLIGQFAKNFNF